MFMYYIGIDIGGTGVKAGLVDETGAVIETRRAATIVHDLSGLVSSLDAVIEDLRSKTPIAGIGIGIAGLRSHRTGMMVTSPNIPCLRNINLELLLTERAGIPVVTENDAKAGAYGEWVFGAGRSLQHVA